MNDHYNRLTPAQAERLAMLAWECGEVIQMVGKILRHGYDSHHPDDPKITNKELLAYELRDLDAVLAAMRRREFRDFSLRDETGSAWDRKLRFAHHQGATDDQ